MARGNTAINRHELGGKYEIRDPIVKKELEDALYRDFPKLYINHKRWGFAFDDGWEPLVRRLSEKLARLNGVTASQTKEKFGGLRYHFDWPEGDDDTYAQARDLVAEAEKEAWHICEACGAAGRVRRLSWIRTLCDTHYEEAFDSRSSDA